MKRIVLTIMLMLGLGLNAYANDNTPEGVILAYWEAIKKGDLEKAKSFLDEKSFYKTNYKTGARVDYKNEMLREHSNRLKYGGDISLWTFKAEKKDDMENSYMIYFTNTVSETEGIRNGTFFRGAAVKKINGKWKIERIN